MKILLIILTLFLTNCKLNKIVNHHGIHNLENKSKELIINKSNRTMVFYLYKYKKVNSLLLNS